MQIFSYSPFGYEGALVAVEVDLRRGIPAVDIVGLADGAIKESRERMRAAIRNSGFEFPLERVLINLAPADLKKEGAGFDLALALAVLEGKERLNRQSGGKISILDEEAVLVMGELELSGAVRPVRAVHGAVSTAFEAGIKKCIVSAMNADEAREVSGMEVCSVNSLEEAFDALKNPEMFVKGKSGESEDGSFVPEGAVSVNGVLFPKVTEDFEFQNIRGQPRLVRALQIAAAGGHNVLAFGPPGCGKTLSLQMFSGLLPLLTVDEAQSTTRIHSIAGLLKPGEPLMRIPPFRQPHQTATIEGMCGGGPQCRPGEVSLAHNGILFLDEASEFRSTVLQMLRVPIESGRMTLSRAGRSTIYPATFQLLLATNPCPCGNYGSEKGICLCSARAVEQHWKKFSGPLLDRVDIRVQVDGGTAEGSPSPTTAELRVEIARAIKTQRERQGKRNGFLSPAEIDAYCTETFEQEAKDFLRQEVLENDLSSRAEAACKKLARTIADMKGVERISVKFVEEAIELRKKSGGVFA